VRVRNIPTPKETFDEPWKQIVRALFPQFLELFAPETASLIDWSRQPQFLDKELRRIAKGFGRRRRSTADFLVKVWQLDGGERWVIVHIELQAQRDAQLPERMFLYNVRAYDLYRQPVMSLAVFADTDALWRPSSFSYRAGGSETSITYRTVKLLDWRARQDELAADANPFALAVLSHLKTQETRGDAEARLSWKMRLARMLFERRWNRQEVEELFVFIDWIMSLPEAQEDRFEADYTELEKEQEMAETMPPILKRAEARGEERGARAQAQALLIRLAGRRLGAPSEELAARIRQIQDVGRLDRLCERVLDVDTWDEVLSELA
jgi:hypothetical protein